MASHSSGSSSGPNTAVTHQTEYEYYSNQDEEQISSSDHAPKPSGLTPLNRSRAQSMMFGASPPIAKLQNKFNKRGRSMSTAQRPGFVPPAITEFAEFNQSDLPELPPNSISRFNAGVHKHIWFVVDTTTFAKRRLAQVLLSLVGLFRGYEQESICLHVILFYDVSVVEPLHYKSSYSPVSKKTHHAFGGQSGDERLTHFEVRRIIKKATRVSVEQSNAANVDIRTIRKVSQNSTARWIMWGSVLREILCELSNQLDIPTTLVIFASQDSGKSSKRGVDALKAMHNDQLVWFVRAFHEISQLFGEIIHANQVGQSTT